MKPSVQITVLRGAGFDQNQSKQSEKNLAGPVQQRETEETSILRTWLVILSVN